MIKKLEKSKKRAMILLENPLMARNIVTRMILKIKRIKKVVPNN